ncbi:MAG: acyloxyacyl hydrolase, partial [Nonlabens sp.]|nr:acyloxyacyl hydrolase [Nonlabens sp.]
LNIGLKFSLKTNSNWKPYGLISSGPMIATTESERMAKGFAFSDVLAFGTQYQVSQSVRLDLRYAFRHNSSAGINSPNFGHNSGGLETGISFKLD